MAEDNVPAQPALATAFDHLSADLLLVAVEESCADNWKRVLASLTAVRVNLQAEVEETTRRLVNTLVGTASHLAAQPDAWCEEVGDALSHGVEVLRMALALSDAGHDLPEQITTASDELSRWVHGEPSPAAPTTDLPGQSKATRPAEGVAEGPSATAHATSEWVTGVEAVAISDDEEAELFTEFLAETRDHLATIEEKILALEDAPTDLEAINAVFRPFHSMKGAAGFLGLTVVNRLAHETETLLDTARKGNLTIDAAMVDTLLKSVDLTTQLADNVQAHVDALTAGSPPPVPNQIDIGPVIADLQRHIDGQACDAAEPPAVAVPSPTAVPSPPAKSAPIEPTPTTTVIPSDTVTPSSAPAISPQAAAPPSPLQGDAESTTKPQQGAPPPEGESKYVKVEARKLDALMELIGELSIAHTLVAQDPTLVSIDSASRLSRNINELGKITKQIQDQVMAVRMVPLRSTFQKMNRLVRDVARKTGKQICLNLVGEDTEIDKTLVEELGDPLVHLLRNACDHGIEPAEQRQAAGKPATGTVTLAAYHGGGNVVIEIRDDGVGLMRDKLYRKALEKGLIDPDASFTDADVYNFIFLPGFSTVDKATDISGRGVGMDVVRRQLERLGGRVEIDSTPGRGSTFTLKMPLTTAIVDGMIVGVGDERYIIPTLAIRESVQPQPAAVHVVQGRGEVVNVRNTLIPLVRLHHVFDKQAKHTDPWQGLVVIVEHEGQVRGLLVDDLLGQHQVVIKNLGPRLHGLRGLAGCAILGDGRVGLILDIGGVIAHP